METVVSITRRSERTPVHRLWLLGLLAIVGAVAANVVTRSIAGLVLTIPPEFEPLHYGPIIGLTAGGVFGGALTFAAISRWTERPIRLFRIVATVALILSFVPDIALLANRAMPGTNGVTVSLLMLLHVVPALGCVGVLTTLGRD